MDGKYWDTFVVTGRVADYLRYKNEQDEPKSKGEIKGNQTGAGDSESDRSDRNGAFCSTYR